jgi:hypothetical protein
LQNKSVPVLTMCVLVLTFCIVVCYVLMNRTRYTLWCASCSLVCIIRNPSNHRDICPIVSLRPLDIAEILLFLSTKCMDTDCIVHHFAFLLSTQGVSILITNLTALFVSSRTCPLPNDFAYRHSLSTMGTCHHFTSIAQYDYRCLFGNVPSTSSH